MNLLLDTHALLWWLDDNPRPSAGARDAIGEAEIVFVSAATAWEIGIKQRKGKLRAPDDLEKELRAHYFEPLAITVEHAMASCFLPEHHPDPFDRLLIAQARIEGLTLVTCDPEIRRYDVPLLAA